MANIVFDDADLELALRGSLFTAYINTGQICTSGSRLLVQKSIEKRFVSELVRRAKKLRVGDPQSRDTHLGPMISKDQYRKVQFYIQLAKETCQPIYIARLPAALPKGGLFIAPHIFRVTDPTCRIAHEEIFGPVLSVIPFSREEEAVEIANGTPYGLSAAFWTSDVSRAHRLASSLKAGLIWGNTVHALPPDMPYGGIKQSGLGAESGVEGMLDFTTAKSVVIRTAGPVPSLL
jgi:acyl-CoA reductase-like NAD-dependent aldehyde dehydrogenase